MAGEAAGPAAGRVNVKGGLVAGGAPVAEVEASSVEERQAFTRGFLPSPPWGRAACALALGGAAGGLRLGGSQLYSNTIFTNNKTSMSHGKVLVMVPGNKTPGRIRGDQNPRARCPLHVGG